MNATGSALIYSTYLGGNEYDEGYGIAIDTSGNAYVTGVAGSSNFPTTAGAFQTSFGGIWDCFIAKLNPTGTALIYSTFIGGNHSDWGRSIVIDVSGNAFVTGDSFSTNFPTTAGAFQTSWAGGNDVFVVRIGATGSALVYSTLLGGGSGDSGNSIAIDTSGNAYVTGVTGSSNFPTTAGAFQTSLAGSTSDAFITKLNPTGTALIYSTFIGGNGYEEGRGIVLDASGNAYITGYTPSTNFPTTTGALQASSVGGSDAFVTKLNATGTSVIYSTYIGGQGYDEGNDIAIDSSGNIYVIGTTNSGDFPTSVGALRSLPAGNYDVYIAKINVTGSSLIYSTFLGGSATDNGGSITIDSSGNAYVTGFTQSSNFPATVGALQSSLAGSADAFIAKLNSTGSALIYSTYLGGLASDGGNQIVLNSSGEAIIIGSTTSTNFPTTVGAFQTSNAGSNDAYVSKINSTGSSLIFSTYIGGNSSDIGNCLAIDASGIVYATGRTQSANFPTSAGAFQPSIGGGTDAYITKLNATGSSLLYSTYLGGNSSDEGRGIALDSAGNAYLAGYTQSTNFPITAGAFQTSKSSSRDVFVTKINPAGSSLVLCNFSF